jgi:hypothetical protein
MTPTLTTAQRATLKTYIQSDGPANTLYVDGNLEGLAAYLNANFAPSFTVWKSLVSWDAVGDKINSTELVGLTTGKLTQLQTLVLLSPNGINPSVADRRNALQAEIFSAAGGTITRPALDALWRRLASRVEKQFATGTGSDASPATIVSEGPITTGELAGL